MTTENENIKTTKSLDEILNKIDNTNKGFAYETWIPSLNKHIMFKEITTSQQKRLIKSIIDSPVYNTEFIYTLREIIKENCVEDDINIDDLNIIDKLFISLKMRIMSIGKSIEVPIDEDSEIKVNIDLDKVLSEAIKNIKSIKDKKIKSQTGVYEVTCGVPSIRDEYQLEREFRPNPTEEDINIESIDKLRKTMGDVFIGEVSKYIKCLDIIESEEISQINLEGISFKNRIQLIEKLPTRLLEDIIKYINEIKKQFDSVTLLDVSYKDKDPNDENKIIDKKTEVRLSIDGTFFTIS